MWLNIYFLQPVDVDIYPVKIIDDTEKGVMGSCATYHTRRNITDSVRNTDGKICCTVHKARERFILLSLKI